MIHTELIGSKQENLPDIEPNCSNKLKFENKRKQQFEKNTLQIVGHGDIGPDFNIWYVWNYVQMNSIKNGGN